MFQVKFSATRRFDLESQLQENLTVTIRNMGTLGESGRKGPAGNIRRAWTKETSQDIGNRDAERGAG